MAIINGFGGKDMLHGHAGNDAMTGGTGNERLCGGDGSDRLTGEPGIDLLSSGAGSDAFVPTDRGVVAATGIGVDTASGGICDDPTLFGAGDSVPIASATVAAAATMNATDFAYGG